MIDKITIADMKKLHADISKLKTIGEWKKRVKEFAVEFSLTDREAVAIAQNKSELFTNAS
jgi:anti-sigma regulatory factor (Ser/Thr protein kinase)